MRIQNITTSNYQNNYQNKTVGFRATTHFIVNLPGCLAPECPVSKGQMCNNVKLGLLDELKEFALKHNLITTEGFGGFIPLTGRRKSMQVLMVDKKVNPELQKVYESNKGTDFSNLVHEDSRTIASAKDDESTVRMPLTYNNYELSIGMDN